VCEAETLPTSCDVVMKSGNLNFLEPSGPFQACNGTDLPSFFYNKVVGICVTENVIYIRYFDFLKPGNNERGYLSITRLDLDVMTCSLAEGYHPFKDIYFLHPTSLVV